MIAVRRLIRAANLLLAALTVLGLLGSLTGCSTPIKVKKEAGYSKCIGRLLVISHLTATTQAIASKADKHFRARLAEMDVEYRFISVNPLATQQELDGYDRVAREFRPEAVLILRAVGGTRDPAGMIRDLVMDAALEDVASKAVVWRGNARILPNMKAYADKVIAQLQADGLLAHRSAMR